MKRYWILLLVSALLFVVVLAPVSAQPVAKSDPAVVDAYQLSCSGGSAEGSSTAPYVAIIVDYAFAKTSSNQRTISMPVKHTELIRTGAKPLNGFIPFGHMVIVPVVDGHFSGGVSIPEVPEGTPIMMYVFPVDNLETPFPIGDPWMHIEACKLYVGPYPEVGYLPRTIICDSALYDSPAGNPIPGTAVTIGQTFYVDPIAVTAADNTSWMQIFVGGWADGYIRSECVQ
ncbi:MAG: hypothetical protein IPO91_09100 [Chloroflexi bacterium]|jgi:hypothetical protein|nr:hypothetical protein [Chloroflexota bacterium]